ncbi:MAG: hypothetical protein DHS20C18_04510 [Saprospiraceae bacterium]|nr:MAG: hypothetical protein DHS20C18_04510 [Saprospiraceae bacterium]
MDKPNFLESVIPLFRYYKTLGDKAIAQLLDDQLHYAPEGSNSMVIIMKHLSGNMLSRWTDFLNSDGEKPWRDREQEFEDTFTNRGELMVYWEKGWNCLFETIEALTPNDLNRIIYIRNEGHTVLEAIHRQLAHYAYHIGQMVYLAKMQKGENWNSLSIAKGQSQAFNGEKFKLEKERRHFTNK